MAISAMEGRMGFEPITFPFAEGAHPHVLPARAAATLAAFSQVFVKSEVSLRAAPAFFSLLLNPALQTLHGYQQPLSNLYSWKSFDFYDLVHSGTADSERICRLRNTER